MIYFSLNELTRSATARELGIDNQPQAAELLNLVTLVNECLDPIRARWGRPLHVNSGYRCAALNRAVGGVVSSQHMKGQAADITAGGTGLNRDLYYMIKKAAGAGVLSVDQCILEQGGTWLHVSYVSARKNRGQFFKR